MEALLFSKEAYDCTFFYCYKMKKICQGYIDSKKSILEIYKIMKNK